MTYRSSICWSCLGHRVQVLVKMQSSQSFCCFSSFSPTTLHSGHHCETETETELWLVQLKQGDIIQPLLTMLSVMIITLYMSQLYVKFLWTT